jgi:hypothetical protein
MNYSSESDMDAEFDKNMKIVEEEFKTMQSKKDLPYEEDTDKFEASPRNNKSSNVRHI